MLGTMMPMSKGLRNAQVNFYVFLLLSFSLPFEDVGILLWIVELPGSHSLPVLSNRNY
jgi:hypothetical protein